MSRILVDTSVLVRERDVNSSQHLIAVEALEALVRKGWILLSASQCLMEFWAVATRPADARGGLGLTPTQVRSDIARLMQTHQWLPDPENLFDAWLDIVESYAVAGRQVWDARIAAWMRLHAVPYLLTFNPDDFRRFEFIQAIEPGQILSSKSAI